MPSIAFKATTTSVRKSKRSESRSRQRPLDHPPNAAQRRAARKSRMRKVDIGLDDCFEVCHETGYHRDPDVHIGSAADRNSENRPLWLPLPY